MRYSFVLATLTLSAVAVLGQPAQRLSNDGFYQLGYAANLNIGDSVVNITNDGYNAGVFPNTLGVGNLSSTRMSSILRKKKLAVAPAW